MHHMTGPWQACCNAALCCAVLCCVQEVPFVSAKKELFLQFEGNASYPKQIIMRGKLVSV
jgi:hypothetical protein